MVHQSGGGTGFAFSRLRPKNSLVASTGGQVLRPRLVPARVRRRHRGGEAGRCAARRQHGRAARRPPGHPRVRGVQARRLDHQLQPLGGDHRRFMEALDRGEEYNLVAPHTGQVTGRLAAREVFDRIVRGAWQTGDPGLVFLDRINASRANPTPAVGLIEATNPCLAGDALVATDRGPLRMDALVAEQQVRAVSVRVDERLLPVEEAMLREGTSGALVSAPASPYFPLSAAFCTGRRETVTIRTRSGLELICTPDHRVMTERGWVSASDLILGADRVFTQVEFGRFRRREVDRRGGSSRASGRPLRLRRHRAADPFGHRQRHRRPQLRRATALADGGVQPRTRSTSPSW